MVVGISMVKDEADIVEHTVTRMLNQVDKVIVLDNGSTDGTRDLLAALPVQVIDDPEPAYYQSRKMSKLAALAADRGADWVVPFDADEAWYSPFGRIADVLSEQDGAAIATAELYDHVATASDPDAPSPLTRIGWRRRSAAGLPKVACRPRVDVTIHQGNHSADYGAILAGLLVIRHFPYRSADQFVAKARNGAAAINATDMPTESCAHWRQYGALLEAHGPEVLHDVFREHFWSPAPDQNPELIFDPCPT